MLEGILVPALRDIDYLAPCAPYPMTPSGVTVHQNAIYRYDIPTDTQPTLTILDYIPDYNGNFIKPGHYDLALSDDREFLYLIESRDLIAVIPVFKLAENESELKKYRDKKRELTKSERKEVAREERIKKSKNYMRRDGTNVTLKFNKHYREPEEEFKIKQIDINLYNSMGEVYNAFKLGNIDLINTNVANIEDYIGTIGFAKKEYKARQYDYLALNCTNSVLSNKLVRQAIMYGIDKNYIVANVYNNKYKISEFPLDFGSYLYNSEKSVWSYNPDKVKEILTADGWELKNNVWQKKINYRTTRLSFNLSVNSNDANRVRVAEVIKEMLEANGIQVNIVKLSESNYNANLANKNYDIILTGMNIYATPDLTTYIGENNKANFVNDEILGLQNDVKNITDESILKEKYDRILEIYNDEVPYIGLYNSLGTIIYSNNLIADISPNWYNIFYNIKNWIRQ